MPCFGGAERDLSGLSIANLTDQDDIGVLPEPVLQSIRKRAHIHTDFALRYNRTRDTGEYVFDRFLNGDDSMPAGQIILID